MALSLDGFASNRNNSDSDITASLSTSLSDDIIVVVAVKFNVGTTDPVTSLTSPNLTFAFHSSNNLVGSNSVTHSVEVWWAHAADPLSSEVISAVWSGANNPVGLYCFAVNGADLADPWDTAAVLPKKATDVTGSNATPQVDDADTDAINSILLGIFSTWSATNSTVTSGWNSIAAEDVNTSGTNRGRIIIQSLIVSSAQVDLDVALGSATSNWGFMIDAIREAVVEDSESEVVPAVYDFNTPGSDDFTLPNYYKLIVEAWGPAASGSLPRASGDPHGNNGSAATTITTLGMSAGPGLKATTEFVNEFIWSRSSGGLGGTASGGNTANITGGQGEHGGRRTGLVAPGKGGDAPFGGPGGPRGSGHVNGANGTWPGGAGAGAQQSRTGLAGTWEIETVSEAGPGGGAGGYSRSEFTITDSDAPTPGDLMEFFIGTGGEGVSDFGLTSGDGAHGGVRFTILAEPPSEPSDDGTATVDITGDAQCGETLTATFNDDDPDGSADLDSLLFQWRRDGTPITGAIGPTYILQAADVGAVMSVAVTYQDGQGFINTAISGNTAEVLPPPRPLDYFEESPHSGNEVFACYSYRLLRSAYTGPLVRLRAGSLDGEEQDFYPDASGELDHAAIQAWRDGTDEFTTVRVDTWYDQSGNGRHLVQAQAVGNMPEYAPGFGAAYVVPSGRAAIQFNGNEGFAAFSVNGPNAALGFLAVVQRDDSNPGPVFSFDVEGGDEDLDDAGFFLASTSAEDWNDNAAVLYGHGLESGRSPRAIKQGPFPENDSADVTIWDGELSASRVGLRRNSRALNLNVREHSEFHSIPESTLLVGPRIFDTGYTSKMTEFVIFAEDVRNTLSPYRDDAALYYMTFEGEEPSDPSEYISEEFTEGVIISETESELPPESGSEPPPESESEPGSESDMVSASESEPGTEPPEEPLPLPPPVQINVSMS